MDTALHFLRGYRLPTLLLSAILVVVSLHGCSSSDYRLDGEVNALKLSMADGRWDGVTVPEGEQCKMFNGDGSSPAIRVENIPEGTDAIIIEFSDRSWFPMNHGGHGKLGMHLNSKQQSVVVPSVHGETLVLTDPRLFIFRPHQGGRGQPGAYLPPCSGGRGNRYVADVKAIRFAEGAGEIKPELLAEGSLFLGSY